MRGKVHSGWAAPGRTPSEPPVRDLAPISDAAWAEIEEEAKRALWNFLAARRLVDFTGPHGWDAAAVALGSIETLRDGPVAGVEGARRLVQPYVELRARFSEGLTAYRAQRWEEARRAFEAALLAIPDDGPSMTFIKRIDKLVAAPPGEGWDGSWHLERK